MLHVMDLELRHLRAFEAVGRKRSFTDAARSLHLTQPALSRTIQQLESRLGGVRLIDRSPHTVDLTPRGQRLFERAARILREVEEAVAAVALHDELRIGYPWHLPEPWTSRTVAAFEYATGVAVHLARHEHLAAALKDHEVEIALTRSPLTEPGIVSAVVLHEPRVLAVSTRSRLARRDSIPWNEVGGRTVVVHAPSGDTRASLWTPEHRPTSVIECSDYDEWVALVALGRGVATIPASEAATLGGAGLAFVPLDDAPPVPLHMAWSPGPGTALVHSFRRAAESARPRRARSSGEQSGEDSPAALALQAATDRETTGPHEENGQRGQSQHEHEFVAAGGGEEALGSVGEVDGAEHVDGQDQACDACEQADDQGDAADQLRVRGQGGGQLGRRHAHLLEVRGGPVEGPLVQFLQTVHQEDDAQADPQEQEAEGR